MNALAPVTADNLQRLIPRLGSNHDGEVIATVAAIQRTLKSAGLDLHDLAAAVTAPPVVSEQRPSGPSRRPSVWREMSEAEQEVWLGRLIRSGRLSPWEMNFVSSIREQFNWRDLSQRQVDVLDRLIRRAGGAHG